MEKTGNINGLKAVLHTMLQAKQCTAAIQPIVSEKNRFQKTTHPYFKNFKPKVKTMRVGTLI